MKRLKNIHPPLRLPLALCLLSSLSAFAAPSATIIHPYSIRLDGNTVRIDNVSDRVLEMRLTIEGNNFLSQFPCEVRIFLGPHQESTLVVAAKNKAAPLDYRITDEDRPDSR